MNNLKNKVQLIGHLGQNPDIRTTESGRKWARMSVATNEVYKNRQGETVTETTWHNIVAWGPLADVAQRILQKGSEVVVEGKLSNREYTDKDGIKRYVTEVQAHSILVLDKKQKAVAA